MALRQDIAEAIPALSPTTVWLQDKGFFFSIPTFHLNTKKHLKIDLSPWHKGWGDGVVGKVVAVEGREAAFGSCRSRAWWSLPVKVRWE